MPQLVLAQQQIVQLLGALGEKLEENPVVIEPVQIIAVGGTCMVTLVGNRETTHDVDMVHISMLDKKVSKAFARAKNAVARQFKIPQKWINDDASLFVEDNIDRGQLLYWRTFGKLEVYFPSLSNILALKILVYRPQDLGDVRALMERLNVCTRQDCQDILNAFVGQDWQKEYRTHRSLNDLFPGTR